MKRAALLMARRTSIKDMPTRCRKLRERKVRGRDVTHVSGRAVSPFLATCL